MPVHVIPSVPSKFTKGKRKKVGETRSNVAGKLSSQLKLFRGNWDGKRERAVVCATKKLAMELLGASRSHMQDMFSSPSTVVRQDCKVVWESPGVVFERPMDLGPNTDGWKPINNHGKSL